MDHETLISRIKIAAELGVHSQTIAHWEESGLVSPAEDEALPQAYLLRPRRGESRTRRASDESPPRSVGRVKQRGGGARPRGQHLKGFRFDEVAGLASFSVCKPGCGGDVRNRATVEAATLEKRWTKEFRARTLKGEARPGHVLTFREFIAAYMDDIAAQVSAMTATEYRRAATKHLLSVFGSTRLNEITIPAGKTFETKLKRAGYALATVNGYVNVLLILLHRAVDDFDLIEEFPLKKRLKRQKPNPLALELTDEERVRFFAAFDDAAGLRAAPDTRHRAHVRAVSERTAPRRQHPTGWRCRGGCVRTPEVHQEFFCCRGRDRISTRDESREGRAHRSRSSVGWTRTHPERVRRRGR